MSYSFGFAISEDACANGKGPLIVGGQFPQGKMNGGGFFGLGDTQPQTVGNSDNNKRATGDGSNVPLRSPGYEDWQMRQTADGSVRYANTKDGVVVQASKTTW